MVSCNEITADISCVISATISIAPCSKLPLFIGSIFYTVRYSYYNKLSVYYEQRNHKPIKLQCVKQCFSAQIILQTCKITKFSTKMLELHTQKYIKFSNNVEFMLHLHIMQKQPLGEGDGYKQNCIFQIFRPVKICHRRVFIHIVAVEKHCYRVHFKPILICNPETSTLKKRNERQIQTMNKFFKQ